MEFLVELVFTAVFSLLLAFLFAKLVSVVSSADDEQEILLGSGNEERKIGEFDGEVVTEMRGFEDEVRNLAMETERRVECVGEVEKIEKFEGELVHEGSEMVDEGEEIVKEGCEVVDFGKIGVDEVQEVKEEEKEDEVKVFGLEDKSADERSAEEEEVKADVSLTSVADVSLTGVSEENLVGERAETVEVREIGPESIEQEQIVVKDEQVGVVECEGNQELEIGVEKSREYGEKEGLFSDDDWEGIEKSDVEKLFGSAAAFVASGDNNEGLSKLGSDVQMQLYGLHKVATEGPCHEPPPMALMISARAKWNSWQRLGNMSPEVAMEQYITLLSDGVPGWMRENPEGDSKYDKSNDSPGEFGASAHDLSSFLHNRPENERKPEKVQSLSEGHDAFGGLKNL